MAKYSIEFKIQAAKRVMEENDKQELREKKRNE